MLSDFFIVNFEQTRIKNAATKIYIENSLIWTSSKSCHQIQMKQRKSLWPAIDATLKIKRNS